MASVEEIKQNVMVGDAGAVEAGVRQALDEEIGAEAILKQGLIPAMSEIGELFERQEVYVPEMLIAARAMQAGLNVIKPILVESGVEPVGTVVIGTVKGDLHDIGKNLVGMMLEGAGFEVIDLGSDVSPDKFVEAARGNVQLVGMSALLTTTMEKMKDVIIALDESGLRSDLKIMIGGAPVTQEYAANIGADGYAPDAGSAANLAKSLVSG
jgi:5-methyltetrahydrofolate--homocysteine methyltransferase